MCLLSLLSPPYHNQSHLGIDSEFNLLKVNLPSYFSSLHSSPLFSVSVFSLSLSLSLSLFLSLPVLSLPPFFSVSLLLSCRLCLHCNLHCPLSHSTGELLSSLGLKWRWYDAKSAPLASLWCLLVLRFINQTLCEQSQKQLLLHPLRHFMVCTGLFSKLNLQTKIARYKWKI